MMKKKKKGSYAVICQVDPMCLFHLINTGFNVMKWKFGMSFYLFNFYNQILIDTFPEFQVLRLGDSFLLFV